MKKSGLKPKSGGGNNPGGGFVGLAGGMNGNAIPGGGVIHGGIMTNATNNMNATTTVVTMGGASHEIMGYSQQQQRLQQYQQSHHQQQQQQQNGNNSYSPHHNHHGHHQQSQQQQSQQHLPLFTQPQQTGHQQHVQYSRKQGNNTTNTNNIMNNIMNNHNTNNTNTNNIMNMNMNNNNTNNSNNNNHPSGGRRRGTNPNTTDEMALNQKNHRLAKELSDLRVRHREECKVVSRLTMENMNLASRCREAISQVAALKKEVCVYQRQKGEWLEKMQQLQNIGSGSVVVGSGSGSGSGSGGIGSGVGKKPDKGTDKGIDKGTDKGTTSIETKRSTSPTTELDRIMSQQFSIKKGDAAKSSMDNTIGDKKEPQTATATASIITRKLQELNLNTTSSTIVTPPNNTTATNAASAASATTSISSSISSGSSNIYIKSTAKRPIQSSSKIVSGADNNLASANTKIPISVTSTSTSASTQKDDEFDADIDMVDFFAKSQSTLTSSPGSELASGSAASSANSSGGSGSSGSGSASRTHHRKNKSTDDHMPEDVVSPPGFSPGGNQRKQQPGRSNLLSSIDAFEASFASAFPDTSFTITSESPSSASLNMAFDVPDFGDPFFNSSGGSGNSSMSNSSNSSSIHNPSSSTSNASQSKNNGLKSQIQNLFPESAMNFKTSPMQNPVFDSPMNFAPMGMTGSSSSDMKGKASSIMAPEKLDTAFSRTQSATASSTLTKEDKGSQKQRHFHNRPASTPLSPQSMSAEIQQLDAIANLASATDKSDSNPSSGSRARKVRNVKQPVSYAEPSLNAKLRRGDVLFPKVDADKKYPQGISTATGGGNAAAPAGGDDSTMIGKNPEEVLKDLELSAPAMVDITKE